MGKPLKISVAALLEALHSANSAGEAAHNLGMYNATTLKRICQRMGGNVLVAYEQARERGWQLSALNLPKR